MSARGSAQPDSPIEVYLDELLTAGAGTDPRQLRHLMAEAEAHLRDDSAAAIAAGEPVYEAERDAVARFGPAEAIVRADRDRQATPLRTLLRQVLVSGLLLGGIGASAVGISGVIAGVVRLFGGDTALVDVPATRALSAVDCARWLRLDPHARSCADAALADWAYETVVYRIVLGLLGVLALIAVHRLRRLGRLRTALTLSPLVNDTIAVTLFAAAGIWTLGLGVDALITSSGHGAGQWLSAAPVALAAAVFYGLRVTKQLRLSTA